MQTHAVAITPPLLEGPSHAPVALNRDLPCTVAGGIPVKQQRNFDIPTWAMTGPQTSPICPLACERHPDVLVLFMRLVSHLHVCHRTTPASPFLTSSFFPHRKRDHPSSNALQQIWRAGHLGFSREVPTTVVEIKSELEVKVVTNLEPFINYISIKILQ